MLYCITFLVYPASFLIIMYYFRRMVCPVLYSSAPCCLVLYSTVPHFTTPHCFVLYYAPLFRTVLYCTLLYCTTPHCSVLYYNALFCTVLYCTVPYCSVRTFVGLICHDLFSRDIRILTFDRIWQSLCQFYVYNLNTKKRKKLRCMWWSAFSFLLCHLSSLISHCCSKQARDNCERE